jgi:hypothetical protein
MISPHASILAADEEIAVLEGEIARMQLQLFAAKKPGLGPDLVHRTSSRTDTVLPTSLPHNAGSFVEDKKPDVETQVAHMQAELIVTKKRRNRFTPLCRIPNELLARILAQTQLSPPQLESVYSTSLYNFAFHEGWWKVTLVCNHVYQIAMFSPELWAYVSTNWPIALISTYLTRSGSGSLILHLATRSYRAYELDARWDKIVALGGARFARPHALNVAPGSMSHLAVQGMQEVMHGSQPNSHLAILHLNLNSSNIYFVEMLSWYPALIELSIADAFVKVDAPTNVAARTTPTPILPLLTRLHLERMKGGESLRSLFELLQNTPCLTELIINRYFTKHRCPSHPGIYERKVKLPSLRVLIITGMPQMVRSLLIALSWHFLHLQDLVVEVISRINRRPGSSEQPELDLFPDVLALWKHVTYSVRDAYEPIPLAGTLVWSRDSPYLLGLEIRTLHETAPRLSALPAYKPRLHFNTIYNPNDEHEVLYRYHNISFDTLKIEDLDPNHWSPEPYVFGRSQPPGDPWEEKLDALIARNTRLGARRVTFDDCHMGVPRIVEWVQEQAKNGWLIEEIMFVNCEGGTTQRDYIALKDSGLVENVVWTEWSMT